MSLPATKGTPDSETLTGMSEIDTKLRVSNELLRADMDINEAMQEATLKMHMAGAAKKKARSLEAHWANQLAILKQKKRLLKKVSDTPLETKHIACTNAQNGCQVMLSSQTDAVAHSVHCPHKQTLSTPTPPLAKLAEPPTTLSTCVPLPPPRVTKKARKPLVASDVPPPPPLPADLSDSHGPTIVPLSPIIGGTKSTVSSDTSQPSVVRRLLPALSAGDIAADSIYIDCQKPTNAGTDAGRDAEADAATDDSLEKSTATVCSNASSKSTQPTKKAKSVHTDKIPFRASVRVFPPPRTYPKLTTRVDDAQQREQEQLVAAQILTNLPTTTKATEPSTCSFGGVSKSGFTDFVNAQRTEKAVVTLRANGDVVSGGDNTLRAPAKIDTTGNFVAIDDAEKLPVPTRLQTSAEILAPVAKDLSAVTPLVPAAEAMQNAADKVVPKKKRKRRRRELDATTLDGGYWQF